MLHYLVILLVLMLMLVLVLKRLWGVRIPCLDLLAFLLIGVTCAEISYEISRFPFLTKTGSVGRESGG